MSEAPKDQPEFQFPISEQPLPQPAIPFSTHPRPGRSTVIDLNRDFELEAPIDSALGAMGDIVDNANAAFRSNTFVGQFAAQAEARFVTGDDDSFDPNFNVFDHLTEQELAQAEQFTDITNMGQLEQMRLVKATNSMFRESLGDSSAFTVFVGSMLDIDMLAPLGVTKGMGALAGAKRGAQLTAATVIPTEIGRTAIDPDADNKELLFAPAAVLLGGALGGLVGRTGANGRASQAIIDSSNTLNDTPNPSRGDIAETAAKLDGALDDIVTDAGIEGGFGSKVADESDTPIVDSVLGPDEGGKWLFGRNSFTGVAAKMGDNFPYFRAIENKLHDISDTAGIGDGIAKIAHELGGTLLPTRGGDSEVGVSYSWRRHYGVQLPFVNRIAGVYNEYRGRLPGRSGPAMMAVNEVADFARNAASRVKGAGPAVTFKHQDYNNWIPYALAHDFDFDSALPSGMTIRQKFDELGWGKPEWDAITEGSQVLKKYFDHVDETELQPNKMTGSNAAIRQADMLEARADRLIKRSVKYAKNKVSLFGDKSKRGVELRQLYKKKSGEKLAEALSLRGEAAGHRMAAGDVGIEASRVISIVRMAIKNQLEELDDIKWFDTAGQEAKTLRSLINNTLADIEVEGNTAAHARTLNEQLNELLEAAGSNARDRLIDRRKDGNNPVTWKMRDFHKKLNELINRLEHAVVKGGEDFAPRDKNYFSLMYRADRIDKGHDRLIKMLEDAFLEHPEYRGTPLNQSAPARRARAIETAERMRSRGIKMDSEGLLDEDGRTTFGPSFNMSRRVPLLNKQLLGDGPADSFVETDLRMVLNSYISRVGPAIDMTKKYGDTSMWSRLAELEDEIEDAAFKALEAGDLKRAAEIETAGKQAIQDLAEVRDGVLNTWGHHEDPSTWNNRILTTAKNAGIVTLMGRSGQMAIADAGRVYLAMNMRESLELAMTAISKPREFGLALDEVKLAGEISESWNNMRLGFMNEAGSGAYRATSLENFFHRAVGPTFVLSGLAPATDFLKGFIGVHTQSEIIRLSSEIAGGTAKKGSLKKLRELGINKTNALKIAEEWKAAGAEGPGNGTEALFLARADKWVDDDLRVLFRAALSQEVNKTIITPSITTRPKLMTKNLWGYLLQFKSFPIASVFSTMARAQISPKEARVRRMIGGMLLGGLAVQQLRSSAFDEDVFDQVLRAVDYSGVLPLLSEPNNIIEILSGGAIGLRPAFGGDSVIRDVSLNEQISPLLGPAGGISLNAIAALAGGEGEDVTRSLKRLVPLGTHFANPVPWAVQKLGDSLTEDD